MTGYELLRKKIRDQLNDIADDLAGGSCPDYAAYKYLTGKIEGLALAERDLIEIIKAINSGDELED